MKTKPLQTGGERYKPTKSLVFQIGEKISRLLYTL